MTTTTEETKFLNAEQVGVLIHRHKKTVLLLAKAERLGCIRQGYRSVLFTRQHVDEYLASCEQPARTEPKADAKPSRNPKYAS